MTDLPEHLFLNPAWQGLQSTHSRLAVTSGGACRYPADVVPFAAVGEPSEIALAQLLTLLAPGQSVWLVGETYPQVPGIRFEGILDCAQMVLPLEVVPPNAASAEIVELSSTNAHEMVALTDVAFPGFFRRRTVEMGSYYGVRSAGELIAMGGERLVFPGYAEISAVCTHPSHRGRGYAEALIWRLVRDHREQGVVSWLHVSCANHNAIRLYLRMGFHTVRTVKLGRFSRIPQ